jgi:hypothetical protein
VVVRHIGGGDGHFRGDRSGCWWGVMRGGVLRSLQEAARMRERGGCDHRSVEEDDRVGPTCPLEWAAGWAGRSWNLANS